MEGMNIRFKEFLDYLISEGKISGNKDFASKIGVTSALITEITKGRSAIGIKTLLSIIAFAGLIKVGLNVSWLLTGKGSMLEPTDKQDPDAATDALRQENQALKQKNRELEEKLKTINKVLKGS